MNPKQIVESRRIFVAELLKLRGKAARLDLWATHADLHSAVQKVGWEMAGLAKREAKQP